MGHIITKIHIHYIDHLQVNSMAHHTWKQRCYILLENIDGVSDGFR
jgi:hypothetical protein